MGVNMGQDSLNDDSKQALLRAVEDIRGPYGLRLLLGSTTVPQEPSDSTATHVFKVLAGPKCL